MVATVALSGPDNVGKTTQIRLLARRAGVVDAGVVRRVRSALG